MAELLSKLIATDGTDQVVDMQLSNDRWSEQPFTAGLHLGPVALPGGSRGPHIDGAEPLRGRAGSVNNQARYFEAGRLRRHSVVVVPGGSHISDDRERGITGFYRVPGFHARSLGRCG
jgi:hypothetical protein